MARRIGRFLHQLIDDSGLWFLTWIPFLPLIILAYILFGLAAYIRDAWHHSK